MRSLAAPLLVGLLVAVLAVLDRFEPLDEQLYGYWLRQRNQGLSQGDLGPVASELVLVAIDAATVSSWGATLPTDVWCETVRRLKVAGVTTIGLNTLFSEPVPGPLVADLRQALADPAVVLQYRLDTQEGKLRQDLPYAPLLQGWTPADKRRLGFTAAVGQPGQLRAVWLEVSQDDAHYYSWPVALLAHHLQKTPDQVLENVPAARHTTRVTSDRGPAGVEALEAWPNFPAPGLDSSHNLDSLLTEVSLKQLLDMKEEELGSLFGSARRRIAIVGALESGSARTFTTLTGRLSGPEINAVTVMNLARRNFLLPATLAEELGMIVGLALLVGVLAQLHLRVALVSAGLAAPALLGLSYYLAASPTFGPGRLLPVTGSLVSLVLAAVTVVVQARAANRQRRRERVMEAFRRFAPAGPLQGEPVLLYVDLGGLIHCADELGQTWAHVADFAGELASCLERFGGRLVDVSRSSLVVAFGLEPRSRLEPEVAACGAGATILSEFRMRCGHWADAGLAGQKLRVHVGAQLATRSLPRKAMVLTEPILQKAEKVVKSEPVPGGHLVAVDETLTRIKIQGSWHPDLQLAPQSLSSVQVGDMLGPYRIESFVGQGGMGAVYRAVDTRLLRKVAVKVLTGALDAHDGERFLAEARAVARVQHAGIVAIYDIEATPVMYLAMEFAAGQTLRELIESEAPLPPARAIKLTIQILEALAAVHEHRVIHRDLKPANIMVDEKDGIKLMDFGLARFLEDDRRLTKMGDICGTPEYMAPEHLDESFGEVDEVSDLFAVGTILYEMLTGALPLRASSVAAIMHDLLHVEPEDLTTVNPQVSPPLAAVVRQVLRKPKSERYQTAQEFLRALRAL